MSERERYLGTQEKPNNRVSVNPLSHVRALPNFDSGFFCTAHAVVVLSFWDNRRVKRSHLHSEVVASLSESGEINHLCGEAKVPCTRVNSMPASSTKLSTYDGLASMSTASSVKCKSMIRSFEAISTKCSSRNDWLSSSSTISSNHRMPSFHPRLEASFLALKTTTKALRQEAKVKRAYGPKRLHKLKMEQRRSGSGTCLGKRRSSCFTGRPDGQSRVLLRGRKEQERRGVGG